MKIHKNVFPYECDKADCRKKYDLEGFTNIALLWGFIYLTKGEHNLIGITCPDCYYTTLRKFPSYTPDFSIDAIEKQGTLKRYLGYSGDVEYDEVPSVKYFVPFSAKILDRLSLASLPNLKEDKNKEHSYRVPDTFKNIIYTYPQYISEEFPYSIDESSIPVLCEVENNEKYKVFPRIVGRRLGYLYSTIDEILSYLDNSGETFLECMQKINKALCSLIEVNYTIKFRSHPKNPKIYYDHMIQNGISEEEYTNLDLSDQAWKREAFQKNALEFIEEYKILRNRIDFELICNNELINKFARIFYYESDLGIRKDMEAIALDDAIDEDDAWLDEGRIVDQIQELKIRSDSERSKATLEATRPLQNGEERKSDALAEIQLHEPSLAELIEKEISSLKDKDNVFKLIGSNWFVKYKGKATTLFDHKKIRYLVNLLERPGQHQNNMKLVRTVQGHRYENGIEETPSMEENLPKTYKQTLKETVIELLSKRKDADKMDAKDEIENINQRIDEIKKLLKEEFDAKLIISDENKVTIKGRKDTLVKEAKNARVNVRNNLNNAFKDIEKELPELERHLIQCIETRATYVVYDPKKSKTDKSIKWTIFR